jgi:hypothetical protein
MIIKDFCNSCKSYSYLSASRLNDEIVVYLRHNILLVFQISSDSLIYPAAIVVLTVTAALAWKRRSGSRG